MKNLEGLGFAPVRTPPFHGLPETYRELTGLMAGDWNSFVVNGDPNAWGRKTALSSLQAEVPGWTSYEDSLPQVFVYEDNATNATEDDAVRAQRVDLINSLNKDVYGR